MITVKMSFQDQRQNVMVVKKMGSGGLSGKSLLTTNSSITLGDGLVSLSVVLCLHSGDNSGTCL